MKTAKMKLPPLLAGALVFLAAAAAGHAATFSGLGDLPEGTFSSRASAVSADGGVVVGSSAITGQDQAFLWTAASGMQPIGTATGFRTSASAVSDDGTVVTGSENEAPPNYHAFRWTASSGLVALSTLAPFTRSQGTVILGDGSVILGTSGTPNAGDNYTADGTVCFWTGSSTTPTPLAGMFFISAINPAGSILGGSRFNGSPPFLTQPPTEPCLANAFGVVTGLGWLPGFEFLGSVSAITPDGSIAAGWVFGVSGGQAFRWTAAGGKVGLGDLPGGNFSSFANSMDRDGTIIIGSAADASGSVAFVWDARHGMRNLKDVLVSVHGVDPGSWILTTASDLSADGTVVIGTGTNTVGNTEAFRITGLLADPPTVTVKGREKFTTSKAKQSLRGTADDDRDVARVEVRVGKKGAFAPADGTLEWKFKASLKPGRNIVTIRAIDTQGKASSDVVLKVTRE